MKSICIIPARGGSKRIPKKNIKNFLGKPIINYVLKVVKQSNLFDYIIVSTDFKEIADLAKKNGVYVHWRNKKLSKDTSSIADVVLDVIKNYNFKDKIPKKLCCVYPTSVFCSKILLKKACNLLSPKINYVFSGVKYSHPIFRSFIIKNNRPSIIFRKNERVHTHQFSDTFHDAAQFYFGWTNSWSKKKKLFAKTSKVIELKSLETQDIDNLDDWILAETKYKKILKK